MVNNKLRPKESPIERDSSPRGDGRPHSTMIPRERLSVFTSPLSHSSLV